MKLFHIATDREVGERCRVWAMDNTPHGWSHTRDPEASDVFISVMYDTLVSEKFIAGRERCLNIHPGILPQYRGSGAYSWAIINGEERTGVTLHEMDVDIDHGPILGWSKFDILPLDTAGSLFKKAEKEMENLFRQYFLTMLRGDYKIKKQNENNAKMYYRRDLQKARDLSKYVRAFTFPGKEDAFYKDNRGFTHKIKYDSSQ